MLALLPWINVGKNDRGGCNKNPVAEATGLFLFLDELDRPAGSGSSAVGGVLIDFSTIRKAKNGVILLGATNSLGPARVGPAAI
jgi:hypothetical protein